MACIRITFVGSSSIRHLLNYTGRHRERGNSGSSNHRIDLLLAEQVQELRKKHSADTVENESNQTKHHDQKRVKVYEGFRAHTERNRDSQKQGNQICQHILSCIRQISKHTALTKQISEHQEAYQGNRLRRHQTYQEVTRIGNAIFIF